jgi:hypothetical protein
VTSSFQVAHLDDLDRVAVAGTLWRPVRRTLGVSGFGVNAYSAAKAGDELIEPHDELSPGAGGEEELYVVVAGAAVFEIDGERVEAPTGTMILVPVGVHREARAAAPDSTVLVIGGPPGAALPPSPFEYWFAAEPAYARGDYDEAIRIAAEGLEHYPEHPTLNYQLACYEALAGHADEALRRIAIAAAAKPEVIEWAAGDADLDSLRQDPRFPRAAPPEPR